MHSHHHHREQQVAHRRVHHILKDHPEGATHHAKHGGAFSKVTSKTAAEHHAKHVHGGKAHKRHARGGNVKHDDVAEDKKLFHKMMVEHEQREAKMEKKAAGKYARGGRTKGKGHKGQQTNISILLPHKSSPPAGGPPMMPPGAGGGPGGPPAPLPGGPPGLPPGLPPGGPPPMMRARGGRTIDGESTPGNIKAWSKRASDNSYFRGGAASGVGREEKAEHMKRRHRGK